MTVKKYALKDYPKLERYWQGLPQVIQGFIGRLIKRNHFLESEWESKVMEFKEEINRLRRIGLIDRTTECEIKRSVNKCFRGGSQKELRGSKVAVPSKAQEHILTESKESVNKEKVINTNINIGCEKGNGDGLLKKKLLPVKHSPSQEPKYIIGDDGDVEWLCEHGVGHSKEVHTCDGCEKGKTGGAYPKPSYTGDNRPVVFSPSQEPKGCDCICEPCDNGEHEHCEYARLQCGREE